MKYLQRLGKTLMLPVACLPVAGILIGIGYWINSFSETNVVVASFLLQAGNAIINNIPILFVIGVSVGMAKERNGTSALAGLVCWLLITQILSPEGIKALNGKEADPAFENIGNVFTAILSGLIGAFCYNRFKDTKLPEALAFFSGKRSVAIVSAGVACIISILLFFIWPALYHLLISFGHLITGTGAIGAGLYVFFNRLLIPFGLHHALNQVFWFDVAGINDLGNFWSGQGTLGETGQYMAGFFPMMMFGLPAAALAMYHTALPKRKKAAGGLLLAAALSSFLTGVTEPLEFSFMFTAPLLYVIHAFLSGITAGIVAALPVRAGFNFSAGLVDYLLSFKAPMALHPARLLLIGAIVGTVYYFVFRFTILHFRLRTPGREEEDSAESPFTKNAEKARTILKALGGKDNIADLDNCISRLRIEVHNMDIVDINSIKLCGYTSIKTGKNTLQIIVGPDTQFLADKIRTLFP